MNPTRRELDIEFLLSLGNTRSGNLIFQIINSGMPRHIQKQLLNIVLNTR